jgi:hypothetical protein
MKNTVTPGGFMRLPNEQGGMGKYDGTCESVSIALGVPDAVLLIVLNGPQGSGFSLTTKSLAFTKDIPAILRAIADGIEEQNRQAGSN